VTRKHPTPAQQFESAFERQNRRNRIENRIRIARYLVVIAILMVSSTALGWGWGYNSRVAEECTSRDGVWNSTTQTCIGPDGEISMVGAP
jgi:hypothetical protein